jgi:diguanylate cyclase (GGDEF)-like protein
MEEEFKRHCRFGEPLSLALMDLDHFKEVNDRSGHRAGDEVLREAAQLLVKHSRSFSIVTRYGGDEFAIILVNTTKAGGLTYAERIRNVIEQNRFAHSASLPEDATTVDDLVVAADRALYDAKRMGRNRAAAP